jgi:hypothetical protein
MPQPGWIEVPGEGRTDVALASVAAGNKLHIFAKGMRDSDQRIFVNTWEEGNEPWTGWVEVPGDGRTDVAPEVTTFHGNLYLFCTGLDSRIYLNVQNEALWIGWSEVPGDGRTDAGLSATVHGDVLYLCCKGTDQHIYLNTLSGEEWSGWQEVPGN